MNRTPLPHPGAPAAHALTAPKRRRTGRVVLTVLAVVVALAFLVPVLWLIASTFRSSTETFANSSSMNWHMLWPAHWTLENLRSAVDNGFLRNLANSVIVAAVTVVLGIAISAMAAFALAVVDFPGRRIVFGLVVLSFLVPFEAIAIPLAHTFSDWGLTNNFPALVLPGLGNGLAIFTLRQFFLGIPPELAEAARVDGAGWPRIFLRIYLPLTRPALIGTGLVLFLFQWQAYLWPILVTTSDDKDVAPVAIAKTFAAFSSDYGRVFAETAVLAVIPAVILLGLQRYFVASVASTGSKN
ncbi:carbohydrate ABC transporter permease [Streptomyces liangshanensis]|uniref:Carbohydrate ABC transporter permease n=1 Tax=Streptomyces liangshanensis TaxID=2717324 RepID=A0A6G9H6P2_9ACTN|nr:carbohydrate ABC transporter permease [Streptomyces liangshanensis]QIQ06114.1 carbohydrate ABC transporter permease [Streptomyces liangshanensis]